MKNLIKLTLLIALGSVFHAEAATIYTNGPANITDGTIGIGADAAVSDSFTVSTPSLLSSVEAVLGTGLGGVPVSVDWSIGTAFFGTDISSGTGASLSNTFLFTNTSGESMYASTFPVISGVLAPGTYYLTLTNGVNSDGTRPQWDVNNGPSSAEFEIFGAGIFPTGSEAFTIFGSTTAAVPDSGSTFGLLLLSLTALFGVTRFHSLRVA